MDAAAGAGAGLVTLVVWGPYMAIGSPSTPMTAAG